MYKKAFRFQFGNWTFYKCLRFFILSRRLDLRSLCACKDSSWNLVKSPSWFSFSASSSPHWCSSDEEEEDALRYCQELRQTKTEQKLKLKRPLTSALLFSHRRLSPPFLWTPWLRMNMKTTIQVNLDVKLRVLVKMKVMSNESKSEKIEVKLKVKFTVKIKLKIKLRAIKIKVNNLIRFLKKSSPKPAASSSSTKVSTFLFPSASKDQKNDGFLQKIIIWCLIW